MAKIIAVIMTALPYAHDKEVKANLEKALQAMDRDLEDVGFESSTDTEAAQKELERSLNEFDERVATNRAELREAIAVSKEEEGDGGE